MIVSSSQTKAQPGKLGTRTGRTKPKSSATPKTSPEEGGFHPRTLLSKGWKQVQRQTSNAASVSTNLRLGSRQLRPFLGTGIASCLGVAGSYIGLAAAGLRAAGGAEKLFEAVKKREVSKGLDGVRDLGSAALLGLASASMFALRRVVLPISGGFNTFRGAYNYARGVKTNDKALRARGALDGIRSLGLTARALKGLSPWFLTAGRALAPVAGVMQAHQGSKKLAAGLRSNNNKLELKGMVDITSAVGLTLLLTGVATMPGLAIFSTAQTLYSAYNMSKTARKYMDKGIDKLEPTGLKVIDGVRDFKASSKETVKRLLSPFFVLPESEPVEDSKATAERLEEDGWEAYLAVFSENSNLDDATPGTVLSADEDFDDDDDLFAA